MKHYFSRLLRLVFIILPVLSLYGISSHAAGKSGSRTHFYFEETFFPIYISKNNTYPGGGSISQNVATESGFGVDSRTTLGFVWNNFLMGLSYNMYSSSSKRSYTTDNDGFESSTSKQEYGPTLGYFLGNWRLALTYFINANKTHSEKYVDTTGAVSTDDTWKNTAGSGFQVAFGYEFKMGAGFGISPTLAYRAVTYSKQSHEFRTASASAAYPATKMQTKAIDSELSPMITITYSY